MDIEVYARKHRANVGLILSVGGEDSVYLSPEKCRELAAALLECAAEAEGNGGGRIITVDLDT